MARPLILCLDDDPDLLYLHGLVLERAGFEILRAADSEAALALLQQHAVALIVTDHVMPGRSGEDLIQQMRRLRPDAPILLLTGMPKSAVGESTADAVLEKTSGSVTLIETVRSLLGTRRRAAPKC